MTFISYIKLLKMKIAFTIFSLLGLTGCVKEDISPDAPDNLLISKVQVLSKSNVIQEITYSYNDFNFLTGAEVSNLEDNSREKAVFSYLPLELQIDWTIISSSNNESHFSYTFYKNAAGYLTGYRYTSDEGVKTFYINRTEENQILSITDEQDNPIQQFEYDEYGISRIEYISTVDSTLNIPKTIRLTYNLQESYSEGITDPAIIAVLSRDSYQYQPYKLFNTDILISPHPSHLLATTQTIYEGKEPLTFYYDYARMANGTITEARKYTADFRYDFRIKYSYIDK